MALVGVLTNPASTRLMQQGLDKVREVIEDYNGVFHFEINSIADVSLALRRFAEYGADVVAINGGDGTIREAFSCLFTERPFERLPSVALLPAGKTNMMAEDFGAFGTKPHVYLRRVLEMSREMLPGDHRTTRHILKVEGIPGHDPLYGMFFGTAGIVQGIEMCRRRIYPMGLPNVLSHTFAILGFLGGSVFGSMIGRHPFRTEPVHVYLDGRGMVMGHYFVVTATTLDRLLLGPRPFGSEGKGPIRFLSVEDSPRTVLRTLRMVLTGSIAHRGAVGLTARNASSVRLRLDCPLTVDGELYEVPPHHEIRISADSCLDFITFGGGGDDR